MHIEVKSQKLKKTNPQLYHGHTTIELKNIRTGSRERIESDNEFTLGIKQFLQSSGACVNSPFDDSNWRNLPLYQSLLGGILLFDKAIEKVDNKFPTVMPAGTKMVANAAYSYQNSSEVTEMGTFNANESSFNSTGLTFVYDWSTDQAVSGENIECVCLTSNVGGYIGYGNSISNVAHVTKPYGIDSYQQGTEIPETTGFVSIKGDFVYSLAKDSENNVYNIVKRNIAVDTLDIFSRQFGQTMQIAVPSALQGSGRGVASGCDGKFIDIPTSITQGQTYTIGICDIESGTWEYVTFEAPTTHNIELWGTSAVYRGYVFLADSSHDSNPYPKYRTVVNISTGNAFYEFFGNCICQLGDELFLHTDSYNKGLVRIRDLVNDTDFVTNSAAMWTYMTGYLPYDDNRFLRVSRDNLPYKNIRRNPLYLATINNLDEPVTKTAQQTMKVTYTVTPA